MTQRIITILILVAFVFASGSGFSAVICHGDDGHVSIESAVHDHCDCPVAGGVGVGDGQRLSDCNHGRCTDVFVMTSLVSMSPNASRASCHPALTPDVAVQYVLSVKKYEFERVYLKSVDIPSYHVSLRSIIIQA